MSDAASVNYVPSLCPLKPQGRRLRVFAGACNARVFGGGDAFPFKGLAWEDALKTAEGDSQFHAILSELPMVHNRSRFFESVPAPEEYEVPRGQRSEAELTELLQDLAWEITDDITEACAAFDDPDFFYAGVDEGIEPVPDAHVELVIWGLQRELGRELRTTRGTSSLRPAVPLADLPWRVQRALAERRRLRYLQFGIGRETWERGVFSLWQVPEDPDWLPRKALRRKGMGDTH